MQSLYERYIILFQFQADKQDKSRLKELRGQLEPFFPGIKEQHEEVKKQLEMLRNQREEIESADQEELRLVREEISIVSEGLETRRAEMQIKEREAAELASQEAELRKQIEECGVKITRAERVKEMNRGFEKNEVEGFRGTPSTHFARSDGRNAGVSEIRLWLGGYLG